MRTPKFAAQSAELEELLKRTGISLDELSKRTGLNPRTLANAASGTQKLSEMRMKLIRNAGTVPVYKHEQVKDDGIPSGKPIQRLRYVPVISWTRAGEATSFEEISSDSIKRVATDTKDPSAFGVDIVGDSMEPNYREGETVILVPHVQARNGNLVVANLKVHGPVLKIFHLNGQIVTLTSFNPAYPKHEYTLRDFHWIYPVDTVVKKVLH